MTFIPFYITFYLFILSVCLNALFVLQFLAGQSFQSDTFLHMVYVKLIVEVGVSWEPSNAHSRPAPGCMALDVYYRGSTSSGVSHLDFQCILYFILIYFIFIYFFTYYCQYYYISIIIMIVIIKQQCHVYIAYIRGSVQYPTFAMYALECYSCSFSPTKTIFVYHYYYHYYYFITRVTIKYSLLLSFALFWNRNLFCLYDFPFAQLHLLYVLFVCSGTFIQLFVLF